jgi:hypothetical protein
VLEILHRRVEIQKQDSRKNSTTGLPLSKGQIPTRKAFKTMNIIKPFAIGFFLWEDFKKRNDWASSSP